MKLWRLWLLILLISPAAMAIQVYVLPTVQTGFPITLSGACSDTFQANPGAQPCTYTSAPATLNFTDSSTPTPKTCVVTLDATGAVIAATTTCTATSSGGANPTIIVSSFSPPPPPGVTVYIGAGNTLNFPVTLAGACSGAYTNNKSGAIVCSISADKTTLTLTDSASKSCALVLDKNGSAVTMDPATTCIATSTGGANPTFVVNALYQTMTVYLNATVSGGFPIAVSGACTVSLTNSNAVPCSVPSDMNPITLTLADSNNNTCTLVLDNGPGGLQMDNATTCQATSTVSIPATVGISSVQALAGCGGYNGGQSSSWCTTARYGDYLSAQLKSTRKFGYGMFVVKMVAADGPTCSTFWLYSDAPAPGAAPQIAQLWRWNEFDFEFVPYTEAYQNAYVLYNGPSVAPSYFGSTLDWTASDVCLLKADAVKWVSGQLMKDDFVFKDMQHFYNLCMQGTTKANSIPDSYWNFKGVVETTGTGGTEFGGVLPWTNASVWKYPMTAVSASPPQAATAAGSPLQMVALNWWRTPVGNQSIPVALPGVTAPYNYNYIEKLPTLSGSTLATSATQATMNNETYMFPGAGTFTPYTKVTTYTVVWTPTQVSYYVDAPGGGTDIANATPVLQYNSTDFPSMAASGTQAPQGTVTWADTSLADKLGEVSINLANYVAFSAAANVANSQLGGANPYAATGWSGVPPASGFASTTAYFRSVAYYACTVPDCSTPGFSSTPTWGFDLSDGSWNAENFSANLSKYFGILYSQDATASGGGPGFPTRDAKSPLGVNFVLNSNGAIGGDSKPFLALTVAPSQAYPKRNFFVVSTDMDSGSPVSSTNPFKFVNVTLSNGASFGVSGVSTPLSFFAPAQPTGGQGTACISPYTGVAGLCNTATVTLNLYMSATYAAAFPDGKVPATPDASATLTLYTDSYGYIWWTKTAANDPYGIVAAFSAQNPQTIKVQQGSATPGS